MSRLTPEDYRHLFKVEAAQLSQTSVDDLVLEIPHLEGWTVQSVVGHTGWVFRYADLALRADPENPPSRASVPEPPPTPPLRDRAVAGAAELAETLDRVDLNETHPTWTGPQPALWWLRRISHEVSMHRWDAESAVTSPAPIDARQALDGIDEVLEVFAPNRMQFVTLAGAGESVHLHATDVDDGEWVLRYEADHIPWEHAHEKCDVAARGTASDLLLLLWGRIPPSRLQVFGDASLLERWQAAAAF